MRLKRLGCVLAVILFWVMATGGIMPAAASAAATQTVVDMAGRRVAIPAKVTKVFSTSPMGTIFMYTLAPDKIAGLSWRITDTERHYTLESFQKLPLLGGSFGGKQDTTNYEQLIKIQPSFILSLGDIDSMAIESADRLQAKLHIPVLMYDGGFEKIGTVYRKLGGILGVKSRAAQLAAYWRSVVTETRKVIRKIPQDQRIRVYYAEGVNGLETDPQGSRHAEVLDLAGGENVAKVPEKRGYGRSLVSMEQLLTWNPDLVIVCSDQGFAADRFYSKIFSDPVWAKLKAVKQKEVYEIPFAPFNWFDRPPSVNRIIGLVWLRHLLYPQYFMKADLGKATREFYRLFYHYRLSDAEVADILKNSRRKK
jgi:iron complex transport system substrate-binding protein